jgi:hypothetical protein
MTDQEKRDQKAAVIEELAAVQELVGHLEVRAKRMGEVLAGLGERLQSAPEELYSVKSWPHHMRLASNGVPRFFDERDVAGAVNLEGIFRVCDDLRGAKKRLRELDEMKTKLGLA